MRRPSRSCGGSWRRGSRKQKSLRNSWRTLRRPAGCPSRCNIARINLTQLHFAAADNGRIQCFPAVCCLLVGCCPLRTPRLTGLAADACGYDPRWDVMPTKIISAGAGRGGASTAGGRARSDGSNAAAARAHAQVALASWICVCVRVEVAMHTVMSAVLVHW